MLMLGPLCMAMSLIPASVTAREPAASARIEIGASSCLIAGCVMIGAALPTF